jgi:uncharacterized membrane protein
VLVALAAALAVLTFGCRYLAFNGFPNDHFVHLATAQQMTLGALPVRDFLERGLPLMSAASAVAQFLFGPGLAAELTLVSLALAAGAFVVALVAARVSGSVAIGVSAGLFTALACPSSYAYPKLLAYACVFAASLWYCSRPTLLRMIGVAATVALAFLFRHDHGFILGAGCVLMLGVFHGRDLVRPTAWFVVALLVLVAPYLAWVEVHQGLREYFDDGLAFSRREAQRASWWDPPGFAIDRTQPLVRTVEGGPVVNVRWSADLSDQRVLERERAHRIIRRDPVGPRTWQYELRRWSASALERLVRDPAVADTHGIDRGSFRLEVPAPGGLRRLLVGRTVPAEGLHLRRNAVAALFYLVWIVPIAAAIVLYRLGGRIDADVRALIVMAAAVQVAMNATMLRDPLDSRIRDVVAPFAVMVALLAAGVASPADGRLWSWARKAAAGLFVVAALGVAAALGPIDEYVAETKVLDGLEGIRQRLAELRGELAPPRHRMGRVSPHDEQLVEYVTACTSPQARLLTLTFAPEIFFYSRRGFAGGQVAMIPGYFVEDRHEAAVLARLAREDVPLVVMDSETQPEMGIHFEKIVAHVRGRYHEVGRVPVGPGKDFLLFAENDRRPTRRFGPRQLPCYAS